MSTPTDNADAADANGDADAATAFGQVQLLGFDVFGTVVDWRSGVARAAAPFLERHRIELEPHAFADAWRARYQPAMEAVRSGARPWTKLDVLNRENLEHILTQHGVELGSIPAAELDELNRVWERLDPWPEAREGLARLKRRFAIAPVSNGSIGGMLRLARFGGLPWDALLGAEIAHDYKPKPPVYLASIAAAGYAPAEVALVAAHNADLAAARALGLKTIFVRRPHEHGPRQTGDLHAEQDWDVVADGLLEVADLLGT